jgi:ATP-dependent phosphoenolpyruvate carboxykinase
MSSMANRFYNKFVNQRNILRNLTYSKIRELEINSKFGRFTNNGTYCVLTGKFTGRSPNDKYIIDDAETRAKVWWGSVNHPISNTKFNTLLKNVEKHYETLDNIYIYEGYCGADPVTRKKVRFFTENCWQHHFLKNMFIEAKKNELINFEPDFTMINACSIVDKKYKEDKMNSENFIMLNVTESLGIIGGTAYTGEMKKSLFSLMHYWLPQKGILTMHCSANKGFNGDTALFFGLSGTGKTTLSADPDRLLIGDDEHGWSDDGIFNLENGCYAKTIKLTEENEPDIFRAIRPNALLENISFKEGTNEPDYDDISITQNGRVSYPIVHIDNIEPTMTGTHPKSIVFLTCDALGVLPIVSKLTKDQAMYHFLSGYTSKVAGTELGIKEPIATFSSGYGEAFLTLPPIRYAELLKEKMEKHNANVYLVNTGWVKGKYSIGERVKLSISRKCISAILDGTIDNNGYTNNNIFDLAIPNKIDGIDENLMNPIDSWEDKEDYVKVATDLKQKFEQNLKDKNIVL